MCPYADTEMTRIPAIFFFSLLEDSSLSHSQTFVLGGNPIDVLVDNSRGRIVASIDCVHQPGSISQLKGPEASAILSFTVLQQTGSDWISTPLSFDYEHQGLVSDSGSQEYDLSSSSNLLYTLENLRKRGGEE